jgi:hypothetical protein
MTRHTDAQSRLCFVVGPIGAEDSETRTHADWLLEEILRPVMAQFPDFRVKRADEDPRPGLIDAQLINDLLTADLVIADLTGLNPNAFYEIGIRHMAQKPIIHMQLAGETIPFDVKLYRAITFSLKRPQDIKTARERLRRQVEAVLAPDYQVENPVTNARGRFQLKEHATTEQKLMLQQIEALERRMQVLECSRPADQDQATRPAKVFRPAASGSIGLEISGIGAHEANVPRSIARAIRGGGSKGEVTVEPKGNGTYVARVVTTDTDGVVEELLKRFPNATIGWT